MPFSYAPYSGVFTPDDLLILQESYNKTCKLLGRCPKLYENKNSLARLVIRIFSQGEKDPQRIALQAVAIEKARLILLKQQRTFRYVESLAEASV